MEIERTALGEPAERASGDRRNASFPSGGKLLTHEESLRLAVIHSVEREQLIEYIVERLRREERRRDRWLRRKRKGYQPVEAL